MIKNQFKEKELSENRKQAKYTLESTWRRPGGVGHGQNIGYSQSKPGN
jgi:hypothetical protein